MQTCSSNPVTSKPLSKLDNSPTCTKSKRKQKNRNAEENKSKHEEQEKETVNEPKVNITQRTVLTIDDYFKRKKLAISQDDFNPESRNHKHSVKSINKINGHEDTYIENKIENTSLNTQILTNYSSNSLNQKHRPIKYSPDSFENSDISTDISKYIDLNSDDDDDKPCPNEIETLSVNQNSTEKPSNSSRDSPKSYISVVPDKKLYKRNDDPQTTAMPADMDKSRQKPCDEINVTSSRELEYLTNRYYELYDPTNTDQFLSSSVCRLYQEISQLETNDKRNEGNIVNSVTKPQNNGENSKPTSSTIGVNDTSLTPPGKLITSSTDLKRINYETIQNNLTTKPFTKQVPLNVSKLSEKLSTTGINVSPCKNVIANPRKDELRGNNQTIRRQTQVVSENHTILPINSNALTAQTNQGQRTPEYQIIVENNSQTNKITILNNTEKESHNRIAPSQSSNNKYVYPNSINTSATSLSAVSSHKQNYALGPPVRYEYPLNQGTQYPQDINLTQNCSTCYYLANQSYQLSQNSNAQYLSVGQRNHMSRPHFNNNNYRTMDRVHNEMHFEDNRKYKSVTHQNFSNQLTPQSIPQAVSMAHRKACHNNSYNPSICYERPCKQQYMSINRKSLHTRPGTQKDHSVPKAYPNFTGHTISRNTKGPSIPTSIQSVPEIPNYHNNVTHNSNDKNSLPVTQTQLYLHLRQTNQETDQPFANRPIENNDVISRQVLQPSGKSCIIAQSMDKQIQTDLVSLSQSNLPNIISENTLELPYITNTNKSNEENKADQGNNNDYRLFVSQNKPNGPITCPNEASCSKRSRESFQHAYQPCKENRTIAGPKTENRTLIAQTIAEVDLMNTVLEKVNANIVKLNLNINTLDIMLNKSNDILEKLNQSFVTVMNNANQYSPICERTASTSNDLRENRTEQTNNHTNYDNNNHSNNDSDDDNNEEQQKKRANSRLNLPPEYNPTDSRWTLKYQTLSRGLMELVPESRVYIKILDLGRCLRKAKGCKQLARLLLQDIFSYNALRVCSLTGSKPKASKYNDQDTRPGLDANARKVLVAYVRDYGRRKGWYVPHPDIIIGSIRGVLQRSRI